MGEPMTIDDLASLFKKAISRMTDPKAAQSETRCLDIWILVIELTRDTFELTMKMIIESQEDVRRNKDLKSLVAAYFESTAKTLSFFNNVERCVMKIQSSSLILELALKLFETESVDKYAKTLEELNRFKAIGNPFDEQFDLELKSVYNCQFELLEKFCEHKKKYNWEGISKKWAGLLFASTFISAALIVAGVFATGVVGVCLSGAAALLLVVQKVCAYKCQVDMDEYNLSSSLESAAESNQIATKTIELEVDNLKIMISSMLKNAGFAAERQGTESAIEVAMQRIKADMKAFTDKIDTVRESAALCNKLITAGRLNVLEHVNTPTSKCEIL